MRLMVGTRHWSATAAHVALAIGFIGQTIPAVAQDSSADARIRRIESEVRALQRKVFPGPDGKYFAPEIAPASGTPAPATAATTSAVTDILARLDSLETQIARLTAQSEQNANRILQLEARAGIAPAVGASPASDSASATGALSGPVPTATTSPAMPQSGQANLAVMTGGASASATPPTTPPVPAPVAGAAPAPLVAPAPVVKPALPTAQVAKPVATTPVPAGPSAQRLAAVRAIEKPQSDDPGEDEYSYGFRLWEGKFYPEAQQQLKLFIDKYPRHEQISYGRNLLGRAYLDDGKPRDAASWFLQNYQADKAGRRAADSLLFLSVAMKQLRDTNRACIALVEFGETYAAEAAGRLKSLYDETRAGLKCPR